jgi:hypothetical protein
MKCRQEWKDIALKVFIYKLLVSNDEGITSAHRRHVFPTVSVSIVVNKALSEKQLLQYAAASLLDIHESCNDQSGLLSS